MANKIDSNVTGLAYAEESALKTVSSPVWYALEPNSYSDFGGNAVLTARRPINVSRQRKKGVITDLEAGGGFSQDLTHSNLTRLLQGFFFADIREKYTSKPMNTALVVTTAVAAADNSYAIAAPAASVLANDLILAVGYTNAANNGLKVSSLVSTTSKIFASGLVNETPSATAYVRRVGYQFASATLDVVMNGSLARLNRASGVVDFTTLGLIPGEMIFVGGDGAATRFAVNAPNGGIARVKEVTATYIELDKTSWTATGEVGTGKTIQIFFGSVLKNESTAALIKRRSYQLERQLGNDANGVMSELAIGAIPNELTINYNSADKLTIDLSFVALDVEQRTGLTGIKSGTRVAQTIESAYNCASDFSRIKMALYTGLDAAPSPLFAFFESMTLSINNGVTVNKALGVLGGFDASAGDFIVDSNANGYFADIPAVQAVRNNSDVTMDIVLAKENKGLYFDVPLLALGGGRLEVEQDQPVMVPLENAASEGVYGATLVFGSFYYLPTVAESL
jgi:hypothetical protein